MALSCSAPPLAALHGGEAGAELGVAAAQCGLGVDVEMAREVHGGEEQVAELGFDLVGVGAGDLGAQFGGFFGEFVEEAVGAGPVEPNLRGARSELRGFEGRWHGARDVVE